MRFHKPALTSPVCKSCSRCVNRLREKCNLFFQFVSSRYEKRSTIYTSNKSFSEWCEILGDSVMASAVLDRILSQLPRSGEFCQKICGFLMASFASFTFIIVQDKAGFKKRIEECIHAAKLNINDILFHMTHMAIKIRKSEDEKNFEKRSKISRWKSDIDRALRQYEKNYEKNVQNLRLSIESNNTPKARLFAANIVNIDGAIRGLKDYKLFLDNVDLSLQFAKTTKDVWASLKESSKDLSTSQMSQKQMTQVQQNIENIVSISEQIEDRLSSQLELISSSIDSKGVSDSKVDEIINKFKMGEKSAESSSESKLDEMIEEIKKSMDRTKDAVN